MTMTSRLARLFAVALAVAASGCGHKSDTSSSTTTTTAVATPAAVATLSSASSASGMTGTTTGGAVPQGAGQPQGFDTESAAQAHCASDQVVWLNTKSKVYHAKGTLYYGHTKVGAYVCRKEADAAGDHDAKNEK